ncbi:MAG: preprotein translocase subunit SecE [Endomicrobium sp.]|nr:preprotein translocase subunit SecE [Endomicrobium sp.]
MNLIKSTTQFFKGSYYELSKVVWFGKKEVVGTTIVVVIFVIIMSTFVCIVDSLLGTLVSIIL